VDSGFKAIKMDIYRGGGDVPEWAEILKVVSESVGPDIQIGVDFHWRLTPEQTNRFIELVEPVNLWYIEDPMNYEKYERNYQQIVTKGKIPVVALEGMQTIKSLHHWMEKGFCTTIQHDGSMYKDGSLILNNKPGFGIELNEDYCRKNLAEGSKFFGN